MKLSAMLIGAACLVLVGCETLSAVLKNPDQIEAIYQAAIAGHYEVSIKKDGIPLHTELWACTNEGKLQCKRVAQQ